ncbi:MAG: DUF2203 domain-containing protein [Nitrososphaeraceae archaeon]
MFKLFTINQANEILPEVKKKFKEVLSYKEQVLSIQEQIQQVPDSNNFFKKFLEKKQELNKMVSLLYKSIEELEDMGVMIKSVDEGLLDFPSIKSKQEIWLCWKFGEEEVGFWHGKDEGFTGRKPIPQNGFEIFDDLSDLR